MAVSTFEVFGVIVLTIFLAFIIWFYVVSLQRKKFLDSYIYARGANATVPSTTATAQLNLSCGEDREICIFRATQVCSGNQIDSDGKPVNYEIRDTDPISSGDDGLGVGYGAFNPNTTIDMTDDLSSMCKNKNTCQYTFIPNKSKITTNDGSTIDWVCDANSQLISSYTCIPKGTECQNYKDESQTIPTPGMVTS